MLTIIIPTKDRTFFLMRLLNYYASVGCPYSILIGDSSQKENQDEIENYIMKLKEEHEHLQIEYHAFSRLEGDDLPLGWGVVETMCALLEKVKTPYVVFNADDDFLNVRALENSVSFLQGHKDYSAAHGVGLLFYSKSILANGSVERTSEYPQRAVHYSSPSKRLFFNLVYNSTIAFSVQRTQDFKKKWQRVKIFRFDRHFEELFNSCFTLIQGKCAKLDQLYMVRQIHDQMGSLEGGIPFQWIVSNDFSRQSKVFLESLAESLSYAESTSLEEAKKVVRKAFWAYLGLELNSKWHGKHGKNRSLKNRLKKWGRDVPLLKKIKDRFYSFLPQGKSTLPALLKKNSPYHKDFMPIYRAIEGRLA